MDMTAMPAGWFPDESYTVVSGAPDEPGEVVLVMLSESPSPSPLEAFAVIPYFPDDAATAGEASALLSSRGLGTQFYELVGDELIAIDPPASSSNVISNHPSSPAGTTVTTGTIVGVVVHFNRAPPESE
jgi:hypothetical protein